VHDGRDGDHSRTRHMHAVATTQGSRRRRSVSPQARQAELCRAARIRDALAAQRQREPRSCRTRARSRHPASSISAPWSSARWVTARLAMQNSSSKQDRRGAHRSIARLSEGLVRDGALTARTRPSRARRGYRRGHLLGRENRSAARLPVLQGSCARQATRRCRIARPGHERRFHSRHTVPRTLPNCLAGRL